MTTGCVGGRHLHQPRKEPVDRATYPLGTRCRIHETNRRKCEPTEMNLNFQRFVGIDWSGAREHYQKKIAIAVCEDGAANPELLKQGQGWTRREVFEEIVDRCPTNTLIGLDFAFSYPHVDLGAYFPGDTRSPESPQALWALIDQGVHSDKDFYGRWFAHGWAKEYYQLSEEMTGSKYEERFRVTDRMCHKRGASAQSVFKLWGPGHVGTGTLAGMRVLHQLKAKYADRIAIWPFDEPRVGQIVIVEIYPTYFLYMAGERHRDYESVARALRFFGCRGDFPRAAYTDDEVDALISAAALRRLCSQEEVWHPTAMTEKVRISEGWIFGAY